MLEADGLFDWKEVNLFCRLEKDKPLSYHLPSHFKSDKNVGHAKAHHSSAGLAFDKEEASRQRQQFISLNAVSCRNNLFLLDSIPSFHFSSSTGIKSWSATISNTTGAKRRTSFGIRDSTKVIWTSSERTSSLCMIRTRTTPSCLIGYF